MSLSQSRIPTILCLCGGSFVESMIVGMPAPFLANVISNEPISPVIVGLIFSAYPGTAFILSPLWARLSEGNGVDSRVRISLAGSIVLAFATGAFGFLENFPTAMLFLRCIQGGAASAVVSHLIQFPFHNFGLSC
jgi:MFS family permease